MKHYFKTPYNWQITDCDNPDTARNWSDKTGLIEIEPKVNNKVWGKEKVLFNEDHCVKIMNLNPGQQVSFHWHQHKKESFILISGELVIETLDHAGELYITILTNQLESFTLDTNVPHTFYCPDGQEKETIFLEASTYDRANDSYRIFPSRKREPKE